MESALYVGKVRHQRTAPIRNGFAYTAYFTYLDLSELDELDASLRLFGHDRGRPFALRDRDHGPRDGTPLRPWIDGLLAEAGIDLTGGAIRVLTFPTVLGFKFFPVSFWYCRHADGSLRAVLAEVGNTFGQHHNYLLHAGGAVLPWDQPLEAVKVFHVSPFIGMPARYTFRLSEPGDGLRVHIVDSVEGAPLLIADLSLKRRPLTDANLLRLGLRFGPMSARALVLIHRQALRLWRRKAPYFKKPALPAETTTWGGPAG